MHAGLRQRLQAGLGGLRAAEAELERLRSKVREHLSHRPSLSVPEFKELAGVSLDSRYLVALIAISARRRATEPSSVESASVRPPLIPLFVAGFLTIPQLAEKLGVSRWWIHDRIRSGTIKAKRDANAKCYLFPDTLETLEELKATITEFQHKLARGKGHQDA